ATTIVRLAKEAGAELFHTPAGDKYFTVGVNGHREHHRLNSHAAREYLTRLFYIDRDKAPSGTALTEAILTLSSIATFYGALHDVHVRLAGDDHRISLDLGDPAWRTIEITATGWRVISDTPVRFRRPRGMSALPSRRQEDQSATFGRF